MWLERDLDFRTAANAFTASDFVSSVGITTDTNFNILVGMRSGSTYSPSASGLAKIDSTGSYLPLNIGTGFTSDDPFNDIKSIIALSNNKYLIVGEYRIYNDTRVSAIIKMNSDGTRDNSFDVGTIYSADFAQSGSIYAIDLQDNGNKYVCAGLFNQVSGSTINGVCRLLTNGNIDTDFGTTGFQGTAFLQSVKVQRDNKILAGGLFTNYSGSTVSKIVRINPSGSYDNTFNQGSGFTGGSYVYSILELSNGSILIGSDCTTYSGSTAYPNLVRLTSSGTIDTSFNPYGGASVRALATSSNDDIIVVASNMVYKFDSQGFAIASLSFDDLNLGDIAIQPDGKILISGRFTNYINNNNDTISYKSLIRLYDSGSQLIVDKTYFFYLH